MSRVLLANAAAVVGLWLVLLFLTAAISDVINWVKEWRPATDERAELPNYPDKALARQMFADAKRTVEEYEPYVVWNRQPLKTENVNIDAEGRRIHHLGHDAGPDDPTVAFFGGSTMWGTGAADDGTIPAFFDRMTEGYQVVNWGQTGYVTRQELERLVNLITTNRTPDIAVFYDGFNHIWTHCNLAVTRSLNGHMMEGQLRRALTERPRYGYLFTDLVAPIRDFYLRISGKTKYVRNEYACGSDPERAEQVAETLVRIWEVANTLMTAEGGRFYAFLQPVSAVGNARVDYVDTRGEEAAAQFRAVYPIVRRKMAERGLSYATDLSHAFDGDEYIYIDITHVSENGNAIIARHMKDRIEADVQGR